MNVALMGSVSSSYHCLDALIRGGVEVTGVMGLDPSRMGVVSDYRSLEPLAARAGIAFLSFVKVHEPSVESFLEEHTPDLLWVIGLSQLVPDRLIRMARGGGVGFHPTMLPEGRGRAPVAWTILRQAPAAATLFYLTDQADAGDIIAQREVPVLPDDYSCDLIERTNQVLAEVVLDLAPLIRNRKIPRTPQDHSRATHYPKRTPADGLIDWSQSTESIYRLVRAAGRPYPGAFTFRGSRKIIVWRAKPIDPDRLEPRDLHFVPGSLLGIDDDRSVSVRTADGAIKITEVDVENVDNSELAAIFEVGTVFADRSAGTDGGAVDGDGIGGRTPSRR